MKLKPAAVIGAVAALGVAGVIAYGTHDGADGLPALRESVGGEVVPEKSVATALVDSGCSFLTQPGESGGKHTVILLSRTGAMAGISLPNGVLEDLGGSTGGGDDPVGSLTLVTVGGEGERPRVVLVGAALTDPKAGAARRSRLADVLAPCVRTALDATVGPQEAGSDELLGQQIAARAARAAAQEGSEARVFVVSDGEANAGMLDLRTQDYPSGDPVGVIARILSAGQLPDYTGIPVAYFGIGQNRTEAERDWLTAFHLGLCEASGGECSVRDDLIPVSVTAPNEVPADPPLESIVTIAQGPKTVYRLDSASFEPRTAELVDPAAVTDGLQVIADAAAKRTVRSITVTGHACDDGSPPLELERIATLRAERIAGLLDDKLGIDPRITSATGRGASEPISGPSSDGTFSAADCAANRRVEISFG